ncbi:MAG: PASTA domain-containing protein [Ectothiorhodospiraceae bacterium]|nr:PASTA domain-containing protein [Chromatiales bacterium]MCP5157232.1 PASTA domain-containing protein [Ectothiorhodospiraceae bacterium]
MALTPPPLVNVTPGDPITSEGWNNIITAIKRVYEALNETRATLAVRLVDGTGAAVTDATVTAVGPDGAAAAGLYAGGEVRRYLLPALGAGAWKVTAEAAGFDPESREVEIGKEPVALEITMSRTEVRMPAPGLFGSSLAAAVERIKADGFARGTVIDSHGRELTSQDIKDTGAERVVLGQVPPAATAHLKGAAIELLVSAKAEVEERIKVPDVRGLTLDQAKAALAAAGLALGEVSTKTK